MEKTPRKRIQSLDRAFAIIDCFTIQTPNLTLNEISEILDLNTNTARGLLNTLVLYDYVQYSNSTRTYSIGLAFSEKYDLLHKTRINHLVEVAHPFQEMLANRHQVSCSLTLFSNAKIRVLATVPPKKSYYYIETTKGSTLTPFSASSKLSLAFSNGWVEKKILQQYESFVDDELNGDISMLNQLQDMELPQIRNQGYSVETPIFVPDVVSFAAPIFSNAGTFVGSISGSHTVGTLDNIKESLLMDLICSAKEISGKI